MPGEDCECAVSELNRQWAHMFEVRPTFFVVVFFFFFFLFFLFFFFFFLFIYLFIYLFIFFFFFFFVCVRFFFFFFFFFFVCDVAKSSPYQASILRKSTWGRHKPVSYSDGPMTARYRFT